MLGVDLFLGTLNIYSRLYKENKTLVCVIYLCVLGIVPVESR